MARIGSQPTRHPPALCALNPLRWYPPPRQRCTSLPTTHMTRPCCSSTAAAARHCQRGQAQDHHGRFGAGRAVLRCPWVDLECRTQRPSRESPVCTRRLWLAALAGPTSAGSPAAIPRSPRCRLTWPGCCRCSSTRPRVIRCCRRPQLRARHSKQCGVETKLTIYPCQPVGSPHSMEEPP